MATQHNDDKDFNGTCNFKGAVNLSEATGAGLGKILEIPFTLEDIQAGTLTSDDLPAGALVRSASIRVTTPLTYSAGTTTGASLKAGTATDDDAFFANTALAGASTGRRFPGAAGALIGMAVPGGTGGVVLTFTPTGGTPSLAEVNAGAGIVSIDYTVDSTS
jgi:hypothetical protein